MNQLPLQAISSNLLATSATPSLSDPTSATVHPDPGDDESSVHSKSENERDGLENSSDKDVSDFDSEKAQGVFDD